MGEKLRGFFAGRNGNDALSKTQLLVGVVCMLAALLLQGKAGNYPSFFLQIASLVLILMSLIRVMSKNVYRRQVQNGRFLAFFSGIKNTVKLRRSHFKQRGDYKFFKCPQCKTWLRVPRGKGKLHINCKCGYTLYRKT